MGIWLREIIDSLKDVTKEELHKHRPLGQSHPGDYTLGVLPPSLRRFFVFLQKLNQEILEAEKEAAYSPSAKSIEKVEELKEEAIVLQRIFTISCRKAIFGLRPSMQIDLISGWRLISIQDIPALKRDEIDHHVTAWSSTGTERSKYQIN